MRFARHLAAGVRRYRKLRGMSAQQLSDRCGELGLDISRATLADLENGRRATFTVPELLVLSRALDVPPVVLLFSLGTEATAEIAPGESLPTWDAVKWFSGEAKLATAPDSSQLHIHPLEPPEPVAMFELHDAFVDALLSKLPPHSVVDEKSGAVVWSHEEMKDVAGLRSHRGWMRERGLEPPELPPELAHIEAGPK